MSFQLNKAYNRESFVEFLSDKFLPEDFRPKRNVEEIELSGNQNFATRAFRLGECRSLELEVFEIHHSSLNDARVGIAKDAFQLLLHHSYCNRALIAFVPEGSKQWRFSLLQADITLDNNKVRRAYSNPRRFSFLLGEDTAIKTPTQFLIEKGRVRNCIENGKALSLLEDLVSRFSVEVLTKQFYNELFGWYQWAVDVNSGIYFPNDTAIADDDFEDNDKKIIRLLTRLMFVWFIKQKDLVPNSLFEEKSLQKILVDFKPNAEDNGNYYNAILQNLFFATLNRAIEDENGTRGFAKRVGKRDVKTLYRYEEMFSISEDEVIKLFAKVPFLNGGLFECLDKTKTIDGVEKAFNYDGFSRNTNRFPNGRYRQRAFIPNKFFFDEEKGLLNILKRYNFTIEENTPSEQTVALDPELLGKVFENLLGAYNPETKETARNQSGSFYTPREIVNYMVDECIKVYLADGDEIDKTIIDEVLLDTFKYDASKEATYKLLAEKIKKIKVLDPACGSGAFPMGLLNRMVDMLQKIEPEESVYNLKLTIIENCIYGSDIQNIATQISKLRFFISLICDCEKDDSKPNFGIPTLPNLETKFVTADSLIALSKRKASDQLDLFADDSNNPINIKKAELHDVRHRHFRATTANEKIALRKRDEILRAELLELLSHENEFAPKDACQMALWNPYDQNTKAEFFDPEWMFGVTDGFDIVIGNPPYIQLQKSTGQKDKDKKGKEYDVKFADLYVKCNFDTFDRTGDIYCLFYERGHQLLRNGGHLCFITSNKWMRAGYGESIRKFFANKTNPILLVDFAGVKVFESATVDTNILLFGKSDNLHHTICAVAQNDMKDLSDYVKSNHSISNFNTSESWIVLSDIEKSIKNKIEAVGTPLKDWNVQINYGIKTGYNDAFIINSDKRKEILSCCNDAVERNRTAELIRPILRGKDILRYEYAWADKYLIATFPSLHYDINLYPAVKNYLLTFGMERLEQTGKTYKLNGEIIKARKKTNNKWFEIQDSISYWDDFNKPKVMWKIIGCNINFCFDEHMYICNNAVDIMTGDRDVLIQFVGLMNSKLFDWYLKLTTEAEVQGGGIQLYVTTLEKTLLKLDFPETLTNIVYQRINNIVSDEDVDNAVFEAYNLSEEEKLFILSDKRVNRD